MPPGFPRIILNLHYSREYLASPGCGRYKPLNLGILRLDGNIGEVIIVLNIDGGIPTTGMASPAKLVALLDGLGVALKRCRASNIVRPRQLSFILVGLEQILPVEVGLPPETDSTRTTSVAVTRLLFPREFVYFPQPAFR